jgi:Coenzyme A transferase
MRYRKIIPVEDAVARVQDGDVVASSGYGGNGTPEALFAALERRFLESGTPRGLTLVWAGGQGDGKDRGVHSLGHCDRRNLAPGVGLLAACPFLHGVFDEDCFSFPRAHPQRHLMGETPFEAQRNRGLAERHVDSARCRETS